MSEKILGISVVIPVLNEEENIRPLYSELAAVLKGMGSHEIIFVDDGSDDGTFGEISKLAKKDAVVRAIRFKRNFGKSAALSAGLAAAKGEAIVTMDGDLQDSPAEIPRLLEKLKDFDLVVGWKFRRRDPFSKRFFSKVFNFLAARMTGVQIHDFNCCLKAYGKDAAKSLRLYGELHRYIPALVKWSGYKVGEAKVEHRERLHGTSKYGAGRLMKGFLDLITVKFLQDYNSRPLHLFGGLGLFFLLAGVLVGAYLLYVKYALLQSIGGRPLLLFSMLITILGAQLISLGLLGELIVSNRAKDDEKEMVREAVNVN